MRKELHYIVKNSENGLPLKTVLSHSLSLSRREISRLKFSQGLLVNEKSARVTEPLKTGDTIHLVFPEHDEAHAERLLQKPDILYEDEDLVIVNKPAGMPAHPSHEHLDDDMGTLLAAYYGSGFAIRAIGRLDKDVSGVMVYAKNQPSAARLSKEREKDELHKTYLAIVQGKLEKKRGTLTYTLQKVPGHKERIVNQGGQKCITMYEVLEEYRELSLVRVWLKTGRTHQIRAGFASIGHPLAGDGLYGGDKTLFWRPALHCASIVLKQPFDGKEISVQADMPEDMASLRQR